MRAKQRAFEMLEKKFLGAKQCYIVYLFDRKLLMCKIYLLSYSNGKFMKHLLVCGVLYWT